ncbi:hypothetical protein GUITHDRAFT_161682 [Guillardia theta CCMP2712]|uniref:VWFA domain-containing protein n=1 Tax=Guillardia theta (strain CCMP2712) TaxID=905079 RepID=L1JTF1_GUITC|nr:hypothetical protein GUITHDRAFT_161682 [Guillardia theta CCMP2712]EKX51348.1 hypothetical protein GUITHDRAFT_161682 [Guillardia theta CCMP2712]|eukprot:XP_005838328.1 hypothetical protein GUITHDRAFT_161682 [Guillardia theta CCMP2712]
MAIGQLLRGLLLLTFLVRSSCSTADSIAGLAAGLGSQLLQAALKNATAGAEETNGTVSKDLVRSIARDSSQLLASTASLAIKLRDEASNALRRNIPPNLASIQDDAQLLQAAGADADALHASGALTEADVPSDVSAKKTVQDPRFHAPVTLDSSVVKIPQYCMRIGSPAFGSTYSNNRAGDLREAILGGLAPLTGGKYECLGTDGNLQQPSLDPAIALYCLTRVKAKVLLCSTAQRVSAAALLINATHSLDPWMKATLGSAQAASLGVVWQRIAMADSGIERFYPGTVWMEQNLPGYERFDPRMQSWFLAAASAPRSVVFVLDTGGSMDEFDRQYVGKQVTLSLLGSLGPADSVALVLATKSVARVYGCGMQGGCQLSNATGLKSRLCAADNVTAGWMQLAAKSWLPNGLVNLGDAISSALDVFENEAAAVSSSKQARKEVVLVTNGYSPSPPASVSDRLLQLGVSLHVVTLGADSSMYEKTWMTGMACTAGAAGSFTRIPYRFAWQQQAGERFAVSSRKFQSSDSTVAVSQVQLGGPHNQPLLTFSAPIFSSLLNFGSSSPEDQKLVAVAAVSVSPQLAFTGAQTSLASNPSVKPLVETNKVVQLLVVDAGGRLLFSPSLSPSSTGFKFAVDVEGEQFTQLLAAAAAAETYGPVLLQQRLLNTSQQTSSSWQLGPSVARAFLFAQGDSIVAHLNLSFVLAVGSFGWSVEETPAGLVVSRYTSGFPVTNLQQLGSKELVTFYYQLQTDPSSLNAVDGSTVENIFPAGKQLTLQTSVFAFSSISLVDGAQLGSFTFTSSSVLSLQNWLLSVTLTASGQVTPTPPAGLPAGGFEKRAVRDVLATSLLNEAWKESWGRRAALAGTLLGTWRFLQVGMASGVVRTYPGRFFPAPPAVTQEVWYVRGVEGACDSTVIVSGPQTDTVDGSTIVSISTALLEVRPGEAASGVCRSRQIAGVAGAQLLFVSFTQATLGSWSECAYKQGASWCLLLDSQLSVVAASPGKPSIAAFSSGLFLGEVEPALLRALDSLGLLQTPAVLQQGGSPVVSRAVVLVLKSSWVEVEAEGVDGATCLSQVKFVLAVVPGSNLFLVHADASAASASSCRNASLVSRSSFLADKAAMLRAGAQEARRCGSVRYGGCSSCFLAAGTDSTVSAKGGDVLWSDTSLWERQAGGAWRTRLRVVEKVVGMVLS